MTSYAPYRELNERLIWDLVEAVKAVLRKEASDRLRDVYLVGDIEKDPARGVIERMRELANDSTRPITLYINSAGGNVTDGLAIHDTIRQIVRRGIEVTMEARHAIGIVREAVGDDLERHLAPELRVARTIHLAHSARAESGLNLVWAEARAGGKRHGSAETRAIIAGGSLNKDSVLVKVRIVAKVTSKLQVTVPKAIAEQFDIHPGSDITWLPAGDSIRLVPPGRKRRRFTRDARLGLFDEATRRQQQRDVARRSPGAVGDRGWTRDELHTRGRAR